MRPISVLLISGFLGLGPAAIAAPWSKLNIGRPWLGRGQEEKLIEGSRQQQDQRQKQQVLLLPISPFSEHHQADRSPPPPKDNANETQSNNTLPKWLQKYTPGFVAFGDSYSAGIGTTIPAGTTENACRQGTGAYPFLIYSDFLNHFSSTPYPNDTSHVSHNTTEATSLQWLSCTGSTTDDVLSSPDGPGGAAGNDSQIDMFNYTSPSSPGGGAVRFATLSIGGNDVGFFEVINACVFRFYSFYSGTCEEALMRSEKLIAAALEYMRRESPSLLLSRQIRLGGEEKNDDGDGDKDQDENLKKEARLLTHKITLVMLEILDKVRWERHPDFRIILTGYARFFNAETVPCDEVSLGVWWDSVSTFPSTPGNQTGDIHGGLRGDGDGPIGNEGLSSYRPKLKREVRKRMNILVEGVNQLLGEIVAGVNARFTPPSTGSQSQERRSWKNKTKKKVIFVNYDDLFEGHRFCEDGVKEPDYERVESWFFLPGGGDNLPVEPAPPTPTPASPSSSLGSRSWDGKAGREGKEPRVYERDRQVFLNKGDSRLVDPDTCLEGIMNSQRGGGDWGSKALCYMAIVKKRIPHLVLDPRLVPEPVSVMETDTPRPLNRDSMWYVPTYYGKTFHPRSLAHRVIRDRIYKVWAKEEEGEEKET